MRVYSTMRSEVKTTKKLLINKVEKTSVYKHAFKTFCSNKWQNEVMTSLFTKSCLLRRRRIKEGMVYILNDLIPQFLMSFLHNVIIINKM